MEKYEDFKVRNANWGEYGFVTEKEMQRNYEIALNVEKKYMEKFGNINEPRIGDIVEFADDFQVFKHAKIVEDLYYKNEYGVLCICENGTSFTSGTGFSTSGGAFVRRHKSLLKYAGEEENLVWTWGCNGSGAHQGIYFPLKVRKWIIPYESPKFASRVIIHGRFSKNPYGEPFRYAVGIENFGHCGFGECFESIKAFRAWADYVGYKSNPHWSIFDRRSSQKLVRKFVCKDSDIPADGKPLKALNNGRIRDAWVVSNEREIITYVDHRSNGDPMGARFGTPEYEEEMKLYRKYHANPLGV